MAVQLRCGRCRSPEQNGVARFGAWLTALPTEAGLADIRTTVSR